MNPSAAVPCLGCIILPENRFPLFGMMPCGHWGEIEREAAFLNLVPEFLKRA